MSRFWAPDQSQGFSTLAISAIVICASFALATMWRHYRPHVMAKHLVSAQSIDLTPVPPWIRSDIKQEVVVAGGLEGLSIREEDLTLRVAEAFRMHPWVECVKRVNKRYPANVRVTLVYREPVAMVEVADRTVDGQVLEGGLYPVDALGVLLPTSDFTASGAADFPRIAARDAAPMSPPGAAWGDPRIEQAAVVAAALGPYWKKLELYRILAFAGSTDARGERDIVFRLMTRNQTVLLWGHAPGKEHPTEASTETKIARMLKMNREGGSLDSSAPDQAIDLRDADQLDMAAIPPDVFER